MWAYLEGMGEVRDRLPRPLQRDWFATYSRLRSEGMPIEKAMLVTTLMLARELAEETEQLQGEVQRLRLRALQAEGAISEVGARLP